MDRNLIDYLPQVLKEVRELKLIFQSEQIEIEKLWDALENVLNDQFVVDSTEYGVSRREAILGLSVAPGDTLETRRQKILMKYMDQLPYTYRNLLKYLSAASQDFTVNLDNDAYELFIRIVLSGYDQRDALMAMLGKMIPANLVLKMQTQIPQTILRPAFTVCLATVNINKHEHIPQGG